MEQNYNFQIMNMLNVLQVTCYYIKKLLPNFNISEIFIIFDSYSGKLI